MKNWYSYIFACVVALVTAACGSSETADPDMPGAMTPVTLSINSGAPGVPVMQSGTPQERINSWWIAFVTDDTRPKVVRILSRELAAPRQAVVSDTASTSLPAGNYIVYAFANMSQSDPASVIFGFREGQPAPAGIEDYVWSALPSMGALVPMSGRTKLSVHERGTENLMVEVVRLAARLNFEMYTDPGNKLAVRSITVDRAAASGIRLFPDYSLLNGSAPDLLESATMSPLTHTMNLALSSDSISTYSFYALESSAADHPTGHYILTFETQNEYGQRQSHTAIAGNLSHITRNDNITIPVRFTQWYVDLDIRFYPPIGGYPAVMTESKGDEYYARFASSGLFTIIPTVTDIAGKTYDAATYDVDIDIEQATGGILDGDIAREEVNHEIFGTLASGNHSGQVVVALTFTVTDENSIQYQIKRKLYIIREK